MSERLLPEAIRGSWYLLREPGTPAEALADKAQLLSFRLDGSFTRYNLDGATKEEAEEGDYTFDGDFLIVRGRNTDTFRVDVRSDWFWFLEAKKKSRRLYRGVLEESDFFELDDEACKEIRMLPMRVGVDFAFDDDRDAIFDLVYDPKDGQPARIGCFSVDRDPHTDALWVGLTPLAQNLSAEVWEKVIRQSYLKTHPTAPPAGWVSLELLGSGTVREFELG